MNNIAEHNYTQLEGQWIFYFESLDIETIFEPDLYNPVSNIIYTPTFFIPSFQCFAVVSDGVLDDITYDYSRQLVIDSDIPLLILDHQPDYTVYTQIWPLSKDEIELKKVNIVQDPNSKEGTFLTWRCLCSKNEFIDNGFTEVVNAVEITNIGS